MIRYNSVTLHLIGSIYVYYDNINTIIPECGLVTRILELTRGTRASTGLCVDVSSGVMI